MGPSFSVNRLFIVTLVIGFCVLIYTVTYPLYIHYAPSVGKASEASVDEVNQLLRDLQVPDSGNQNIQLEIDLPILPQPRPTRTPEGRAEDSRDEQKQAQEEVDEIYQAPINTPILYTPGETLEVLVVEEEEAEEEEVEEETTEEEEEDLFEDFNPRRIERSFQSIDPLERPQGGALTPEEALRELERQRTGGRRVGPRTPSSVDQGGQSGSIEQARSTTPQRPSVKDARYLEKGWKKFTSYQEGFTVWVPGELFYFASRDKERTEVYQCDADGVYYGIQKRQLARSLDNLSDSQMRPVFQNALDSWSGDFAAGIPGFNVINKFFTSMGDQRQLDVLIGADAGQVSLRIFNTKNFMFWMWTVYLHDNKERAEHRSFLNSLEILKP